MIVFAFSAVRATDARRGPGHQPALRPAESGAPPTQEAR
jgi:hypothetical protein